MSEWLPLAQVASAPGLAERPVAWRGAAAIRRAQFLHDVGRWQTAFAAHPGRRFALYADDVYTFSAALYGAWHAGKEVFLPGDTQPATLERLMAEVDGCAGDLPGALVPADPLTAPADLPPRQPLDPRATRLVIYTSGSGGEPAAIGKRLDQLDAEMHNLQAAFGALMAQPGEASTVYSTVSHQHIYGLLFCVLWPLAAGRLVDVQRLVYPEQMAERLAERPCVLVSSPAHLKRLPDNLDWAPLRRTLRAVFSSGGPLPPEAAQAAWTLLGHSPTEVYGSSETGGIAWRRRAEHGDRWNLLPGVQWRLQSELLAVRSAHLADDDWWETSDRVRADGADGFVLLGRADRIVKIEEKRVSLTAMENALLAGGDIAEARALLVPTEAGTRLALVAVPTASGWQRLQAEGKNRFNERLRAELLKTVERVALPRRFRYVRRLPFNSQGKSTEALLLALFRPAMPQPDWQLREAHQATARLEVTADLAVFDGHFPEMPVLPGVAQVDWAIALARGCFPLPARFLRLEMLKFQRPVLPPVRLELTLHWQADASRLSFRYTGAAGVVHSSGKAVFEAADV